MATLSIKKKIIMHLYRYRNISDQEMFNLPWEMTQDGIASCMLISRAHSCLELKNLEEKGLIWNKQAHVKGGKVKRRVYMLTDLGLQEYERLRPLAEENNIGTEPFITGLNGFLEGADPLSSKITDQVGCVCVLRTSIPKSIMPPNSISIIRTDGMGMTLLDDRSRKLILDRATEERISCWHSMAADVWLDHWKELDDNITAIHERTYHLIMAGRTIDACRLISSNVYDLIITCNEDLHDNLKLLNDIPEKYAADVLRTRIEADRECNDLDDMKLSIVRLEQFDITLSEIYSSDLAFCLGDADGAMRILSGLDDTPMVRLRMANLLMESGRLTEAREMVDSMNEDGYLNRTELGVERFVLMAKIDKKEGRDADAYSHLMKAMASVTEKGKERIGMILKSMDLRM